MLIVICLLLLSGVCMAEGTGATEYENDMFNSFLKHNHAYKEYDAPIGAGLDLVLYDEGNFSVEAQTKYDFNNHEGSGYLVGKINIWKMITKR